MTHAAVPRRRRGVPLLARGGAGRSPRTLAAYRRDLAAYQARRRGAAAATASTPPPARTWPRTWPRCAGRTAPPRWPGRSRASGASTASWSRRACAADDPTLDLPSISVTDLLPKALSEEETERLLGAVVGTGPDGPARPRPARGALRHGARVSEVGRAQPGRRGRAPSSPTGLPLVRVLGQGRQGARRPAGPAGPRRPGRLALGPGAAAARAEEVAPAQRRRGRVPQRPGRPPLPGRASSGWSRSTPPGWASRRR